MQTIYRKKGKRKNFTPLDNALLRCKALSFSARGILAYMLSHKENWEMNMGDLEKQTTDSRRTVRNAIWELEAAGHATRQQVKDKFNKFTGTVWVWHEEPVQMGQRTGKPTGISRLTETGGSGNRLTGNGPLGNGGGYKKIDPYKNTMVEERFRGGEGIRGGVWNEETEEYEW